MKNFSRRMILAGAGAVAGVSGARYLASSNPTLDGVTVSGDLEEQGHLDDASRLSSTPVHRHITLEDDPSERLVEALRKEITEARSAGRPVNIGAARHSMGAQAIPRDGHAITFNNGFLEPDSHAGVYRVHAGARWSQVIAALDPIGWSPKVMQSNHDFGVAATFCVNAHGWPVPHGPMGATVRSFEMVVADGSLLTCSRTENTDLFNVTMGGYGLSGAIVSLDVEMEKNLRLEPRFDELPAEDFGPAFEAALADENVNMAYGRLNVDRSRFFEDALLITYRPSADQDDLPAASGSGIVSKLSGDVYRAQLGNERIKRFRWWMETGPGAMVGGGAMTRNSLINEPVATLDDGDPKRTDILHEYFIAPARFPEFLEVCRAVIPNSYQEMLNVTLRFVDTDAESYLAYARVPRIAAVMSFSQEMTERAEADMARLTRDLIDGITAIGGNYYLPYRPHATVDQLVRAYPKAPDFAAAKRAIDPDLVFRSNLWDQYLDEL